MGINSLVNGLNGKKDRVYVSISPSIGMEVFQIDNTGTITKYANKPIEYDESTKEFLDLEKIREIYLAITTEIGIKPATEVILNLPTVLIGAKELPTIMEEANIGQSILAEIESSYIFSRCTPCFDWKDFDTSKSAGMRNIYYSALQDNTVSQIVDMFKEIGAKITNIETSYTSILNGLARLNIISNQLTPGQTWNLMIVNNSGYTIFSMVADKIMDIFQEDMLLMDDNLGDVYTAIAATAEITLLGFPANDLVVVSETDMVNAEELATSLTASGSLQYQNILFIDDNLYKREDFLPLATTVDAKYKLKPSLKTVGMLQDAKLPTLARFDFLKVAPKANYDNEIVRFNIGDKIFEITPNSAKIYSIIFAAVILVILLPLFIILPILNKPFDQKMEGLKSQISELDREISAINAKDESKKFNPQEEIQNVLGLNRTKLMSFITIGEVIPKKVWITYYKVHNKDKIIITGVSGSIDDINKFYKSINNTLPDSKLQLKNMTMNNADEENAAITEAKYYDFVITNDENFPPKVESLEDDLKSKGKSKGKKKK